jgi:hypothetical protein
VEIAEHLNNQKNQTASAVKEKRKTASTKYKTRNQDRFKNSNKQENETASVQSEDGVRETGKGSGKDGVCAIWTWRHIEASGKTNSNHRIRTKWSKEKDYTEGCFHAHR